MSPADNVSPWNVPPSMIGVDIVIRLNFAGADAKGGLSFPLVKAKIKEDLGGALLISKSPEPGRPIVDELLPKSFVFSILRDTGLVGAPGLVLP